MIGCKKGCLCSDITKELCCCECQNFIPCKQSCEISATAHTEKEILQICLHAYDTNDQIKKEF